MPVMTLRAACDTLRTGERTRIRGHLELLYVPAGGAPERGLQGRDGHDESYRPS